jgi:hypothetical protein
MRDMLEYNGELYVVGQINAAGGISVSRMAKWNGLNWSALVNNPYCSNTPGKLATNGTKLFIGGSFITINADTMNNITKYDPFTNSIEPIVSEEINIFPNPAIDILKIEGINMLNLEVIIYDIMGKMVLNKIAFNNEISIEGIQPGIYQCKLFNNSEYLGMRKFIKL